MARDQSVRNRIVEYLAEQGAVEDSSGKATSVLKQAIAYEGTDAGFTQVVAAMAKAGLLTRQIRGKRTYRIAAQRQRSRSQRRFGCGVQRARPVGLRRAGSSAARAGDTALRPHPPTPRNPPRGRVGVWSSSRRATRRCSEMWPGPMPRPRRSQPNETCCRISWKPLQHNLSLLTDRLQEPRRPQGRAAERLGPDEQITAQPVASSPSSEDDVHRTGHLTAPGGRGRSRPVPLPRLEAVLRD